MFSRVFESVLDLLDKKKMIKNFKYSDVLGFSILITIISYYFTIEPNELNYSLKKIYLNFAAFDTNLHKFY